MAYKPDRLETAEALTALLAAGSRDTLGAISCSTTCRHLGLRHVLQLVHVLPSCKDAFKRAAGVGVVHILGHRNIVQLGEPLYHLDLILGLELVNLDRMTKFLGYLAKLRFYQL